MGRRPAGFASPNKMSATALPPSSPGYHTFKTPSTFDNHLLMLIALPPVNITTTGLPVAATCLMSSSWCPGSEGIKRFSACAPFAGRGKGNLF